MDEETKRQKIAEIQKKKKMAIGNLGGEYFKLCDQEKWLQKSPAAKALTVIGKSIVIGGKGVLLGLKIAQKIAMLPGTIGQKIIDALDDGPSPRNSSGPRITGPPGGASGWHAGKHHGH
jgi:hypothetical protein